MRSWAAEPGEYYHALDGGYGAAGRETDAPHRSWCRRRLFQPRESSRRPIIGRPDAGDPHYAWNSHGVEGDILGDYGLSVQQRLRNGPCGRTLQRRQNAVVLARSENSPTSAVHVNEDMLGTVRTVNG